MDASLTHAWQSTRNAAAHAVGTSLTHRTNRTASPNNAASAQRAGAAAAQPNAAAQTGAAAPATGTATSAASSDPSTITSSDFLTLLVSELKNQDPTQPTDPNAYISQLVGVNSLEQLIQINNGIGKIDSPATTNTTSTTGSATQHAAEAAARTAAA